MTSLNLGYHVVETQSYLNQGQSLGQAKRKNASFKELLAKANGCIYCASQNVATQVDHMPPRSMFRQSQRPRGLEFPSCGTCNQGTSRLDAFATFMSKTFPGISSEGDATEWDKVLQEAKRVAPGALHEMWLPHRQMESLKSANGIINPEIALFRVDGPLVGSMMQAFAAKVGFALHYEFRNEIVPKTGGVQVRWFTSHEIWSEQLPEDLFETIGRPLNIEQGRLSTSGLFEYGGGIYNHAKVSLYYAKFREAFAVAAFVANNIIDLPFDRARIATFMPGELTGSLRDRIAD